MALIRKLAFRLANSAGCSSLLRRIRRLQEMESWSREQVDSFRLRQLQRLVRHAYDNVPFYRKLWDEAGVGPDQIDSLEDLSRFPRTTKEQLRAAGDLVLDQTRPKSSFIQGRTSGSTAEPFVYYETKTHYKWFVASGLHGWTWGGWELGDPWLRLQLRGKLSLRKRLEDWAFNCLYMPLDQLDEEFLTRFLERAVRFKPVLIRGYTAGAYLFARFLLERADSRLRPKLVACTGHTLEPHYRETIEKAFACRVLDYYGGEGMCVAAQCEEGLYHVYPTVHLELEPSGSPLPEGRPGRILLTGLTNLAMPMIRYDIGDIGIGADGSCSCGRNWGALKRILGRETDIVVTRSGRNILCHHFNHVFRDIDGVEQFQIRQKRPEGIRVLLQTSARYDPQRDEPRIVREIHELAGQGFQVEVEYVSDIPTPPTGKRRYVISEVPLPLPPEGQAGP